MSHLICLVKLKGNLQFYPSKLWDILITTKIAWKGRFCSAVTWKLCALMRLVCGVNTTAGLYKPFHTRHLLPSGFCLQLKRVESACIPSSNDSAAGTAIYRLQPRPALINKLSDDLIFIPLTFSGISKCRKKKGPKLKRQQCVYFLLQSGTTELSYVCESHLMHYINPHCVYFITAFADMISGIVYSLCVFCCPVIIRIDYQNWLQFSSQNLNQFLLKARIHPLYSIVKWVIWPTFLPPLYPTLFPLCP